VVAISFKAVFALLIGTSDWATAPANCIKACYPCGPKDYNLAPYSLIDIPDFAIEALSFEKSKVPVDTFVAFYKCVFNCIAAAEASWISEVHLVPSPVKELADNLVKDYCKLSNEAFAALTSAVKDKFTYICWLDDIL
jgi:hypothetical protein